MVSAGGMVKRGLGALFPGTILVKGKYANSQVALTFDDGPHPENTPRILDILDKSCATATFFLHGREAEKYPALVREISARGHQIGNHGYSHLDARQSPWRRYVDDVHHAQKILQDTTGGKLDKIFRPPFGNISGASFLALAWSGFRFVFWSVDSRDSFIRETPALMAHIDSLPIAGGDILLLHEDYAHTVESLSRILQSLKDRSLMFARISNLGKHNEI